jgi:hypothetical protein
VLSTIEGKKSPKAGAVFPSMMIRTFQPAFSELVEAAYKDLFALHAQKTWELPTDKRSRSSVERMRQATS